MAVTLNRGYPLPDEANTVAEEFEALRDVTLPAIDADVAAILLALAGKAAASHGHAIADITGLQAALNAKQDAGQAINLKDLADVEGASSAPAGYVLVKDGTGKWVAMAALAAVGSHSHSIGDVTGLSAALDGKASLASPAFTGTPTAPTAATATNSGQIATTAFVKAQGYAPINSPAFSGAPTAPTPSPSTDNTQIATTAYVKAQGYLPSSGPTITNGLAYTGSAKPGVTTLSGNSINAGLGNYFKRTITGAVTWTFSGAPASGSVGYFLLELVNGGAGAQTWPTSVKWADGAAPTLQASGVDILAFVTSDGGSTWLGHHLGGAYA